MSDQQPPQPPQPPGQVNVNAPHGRSRLVPIVLAIVGICVVLGIIGVLTAPRTPVTSPPGQGTAGPRPTAPAGTSAPAAEPTPPPAASTNTAPAGPRSQRASATPPNRRLKITLNESATKYRQPPPDAGYESLSSTSHSKIRHRAEEPQYPLEHELGMTPGRSTTYPSPPATKGSPDVPFAPGDKLRGEVGR